MIAITGATGQLGHLVLNSLLAKVNASQIVATARNPAKATEIAALGIVVRPADYTDRASLEKAFAGVDKLLLISSNEIGKRYTQHANVIAAAKAAGVKLIVYTSLLHADTSPLSLADEHVQTETALKASGLPYVILRNGWYTENYTGSIPVVLAESALHGSAGEGRIASASRADYAEAAAVALTKDVGINVTYELAGDNAYTLADLAAEISRQTGRKIPYVNLPEADYAAALAKAGLPDGLAAAIASWGTGTGKGALYDNGHALSKLIGRPTTPLSVEVSKAIQ